MLVFLSNCLLAKLFCKKVHYLTILLRGAAVECEYSRIWNANRKR